MNPRVLLPLFLGLFLVGCKTRTGSLSAIKETSDQEVNVGFGQDYELLTRYLATEEDVAEFMRERSADPDAGDFCQDARRLTESRATRNSALGYHRLSTQELVAVSDYTGGAYEAFNRILRSKDQAELRKIRARLLVTASALNRLPKYQGTVLRGTNLRPEVLDEYKACYRSRRACVQHRFTSTTLELDTAMSFGPVLLRIQSKAGRQIEGISTFVLEREVLFNPGTRFLIKGMKVMSKQEIVSALSQPMPPVHRPATSDLPARALPGCPASESETAGVTANSQQSALASDATVPSFDVADGTVETALGLADDSIDAIQIPDDSALRLVVEIEEEVVP